MQDNSSLNAHRNTNPSRMALFNYSKMSLSAMIVFTLALYQLNAHEISSDHHEFGGHSRDFRSIHEPVDWNLLSAKPRHRRTTSTSENLPPFLPSDEEISDFIFSHKDAKDVLIENMLELLNDTWVYMSIRIKSFHSLKEKLIRKNDTLTRIKDTIGLRLTLQTVSDVKKIKDFLNSTSTKKDFTIQQIRCHGICSIDMKYTLEGYRRIHLLVKIDKFDKWAEIQIGTPYCDSWADWSHDLIYKGKFSSPNETEAHNYAFELAEYFYKLDQMRNEMVSCPKRLQEANALKILGEETYHELYNPISLCFYWTDIFMGKPSLVTVDPPAKLSGKERLNPLISLIFLFVFVSLN